MSSLMSVEVSLNDAAADGSRHTSVRTTGVFVLWTTAAATMSAARVGHDLAAAMRVPLTLVRFCPLGRGGLRPMPEMSQRQEMEVCLEQLRLAGIEPGVRLYLCPHERRSLPFAFPDQSLIVMGGQRGWWPRQTERWRHHLESAGHFVLFVGAEPRQEDPRA